MQLKEFSFICPVIESAAVLKAIETVTSPDAIAQTLGNTDSVEERKRFPAIATGSVFDNCDEFMVVRFNGNCTQKPMSLVLVSSGQNWVSIGKYPTADQLVQPKRELDVG